MSAPPYMKLFWGDYHKATRHLTRGQHGAYFLLIGEAWRLGGTLPDDDTLLAAWSLCSAEEWSAMKPIIMSFFALRRGKWTHDRVREELASYEATSRKRKEAGKRGGTASGGKDKETGQAIASQLPTKPEPEPEPKKEDPLPPEGGRSTSSDKPLSSPDDFEAGWKAYPHFKGRSASKAICGKAWLQAARAAGGGAALVSAVKRFAAEDRQHRGECGAPAFERWLRQGRFEAWLPLTPIEAAAAAPDPLDQWRRRVQAYLHGSRYWNTNDWDAPPGKAGCIVPASVLAEFGLQEAGAAILPFPGEGRAA